MKNRKYAKADAGQGRTDKKHKGLDYEYRVIASRMLGRPLKAHEIVHHIDENPNNNEPSNLIVFKNQGEHNKYHKHKGITGLQKQEDGSYVTILIPRLYTCKRCGKGFYSTERRKHDNIYCSQECSHASQQKCEHPSESELRRLVWERPLTQIAKMYGVSDKAVAKWCKKYNIEKPKHGIKR